MSIDRFTLTDAANLAIIVELPNDIYIIINVW